MSRTRPYYLACFVAYHVVLAIPHTWRLWWALLPHAGNFAHWDADRDEQSPAAFPALRRP